MAEPPLIKTRLKSLDEFESLPWHKRREQLWPFIVAGLIIGAAIGWGLLKHW